MGDKKKRFNIRPTDFAKKQSALFYNQKQSSGNDNPSENTGKRFNIMDLVKNPFPGGNDMMNPIIEKSKVYLGGNDFDQRMRVISTGNNVSESTQRQGNFDNTSPLSPVPTNVDRSGLAKNLNQKDPQFNQGEKFDSGKRFKNVLESFRSNVLKNPAGATVDAIGGSMDTYATFLKEKLPNSLQSKALKSYDNPIDFFVMDAMKETENKRPEDSYLDVIANNFSQGRFLDIFKALGIDKSKGELYRDETRHEKLSPEKKLVGDAAYLIGSLGKFGTISKYVSEPLTKKIINSNFFKTQLKGFANKYGYEKAANMIPVVQKVIRENITFASPSVFEGLTDVSNGKMDFEQYTKNVLTSMGLATAFSLNKYDYQTENFFNNLDRILKTDAGAYNKAVNTYKDEYFKRFAKGTLYDAVVPGATKQAMNIAFGDEPSAEEFGKDALLFTLFRALKYKNPKLVDPNDLGIKPGDPINPNGNPPKPKPNQPDKPSPTDAKYQDIPEPSTPENKPRTKPISADPSAVVELKKEEKRLSDEWNAKFGKEPIDEITNPILVNTLSPSVKTRVDYLNSAIRDHNSQFNNDPVEEKPKPKSDIRISQLQDINNQINSLEKEKGNPKRIAKLKEQRDLLEKSINENPIELADDIPDAVAKQDKVIETPTIEPIKKTDVSAIDELQKEKENLNNKLKVENSAKLPKNDLPDIPTDAVAQTVKNIKDTGAKPSDIVKKFYDDVYDNLPDDIKAKFDDQLKTNLGLDIGDVLYTDRDGNKVKVDSYKTLGLDLGADEWEGLSNQEQGMVALMADAINRHKPSKKVKAAVEKKQLPESKQVKKEDVEGTRAIPEKDDFGKVGFKFLDYRKDARIWDTDEYEIVSTSKPFSEDGNDNHYFKAVNLRTGEYKNFNTKDNLSQLQNFTRSHNRHLAEDSKSKSESKSEDVAVKKKNDNPEDNFDSLVNKFDYDADFYNMTDRQLHRKYLEARSKWENDKSEDSKDVRDFYADMITRRRVLKSSIDKPLTESYDEIKNNFGGMLEAVGERLSKNKPIPNETKDELLIYAERILNSDGDTKNLALDIQKEYAKYGNDIETINNIAKGVEYVQKEMGNRLSKPESVSQDVEEKRKETYEMTWDEFDKLFDSLPTQNIPVEAFDGFETFDKHIIKVENGGRTVYTYPKDYPHLKNYLTTDKDVSISTDSIDRFLKSHREDTSSYDYKYKMKKRITEQAIREGKTVPEEVMKDYPDLKKKKVVKKSESKNKYEAEREKGKRVIGGVTYSRQPEQNFIEGKETEIHFSKKDQEKGVYALVPVSKVQPSHKADGGINPYHFITEGQPRNRGQNRALRIEPDKKAKDLDVGKLGVNNIAFYGASVINQRGEVVQGSGRDQALIRYFQLYDNDPKGYQDYLKSISDQTGISESDIDKAFASEPHLLQRVINVSDDRAIELGNYVSSDMEDITGKIKSIDKSSVSRVTSQQMNDVANMITSRNNEDSTLNSIIRDLGRKIVDKLQEIGVIREDEIELYINDHNQITADGIKNIERYFKESLFVNGDVSLSEAFEKLPDISRKGIEKSIPNIISVEENKSLIPEIQNAIMGLYEFNGSDQNVLGDWLSSYDMFTGETISRRYTDPELELMKIFNSAKTQSTVVGLFSKYKELVSDIPEDLFNPEVIPGKSKPESLNIIFDGKDKKAIDKRKKEKPAGSDKKEIEPDRSAKDNADKKGDEENIVRESQSEYKVDQKQIDKINKQLEIWESKDKQDEISILKTSEGEEIRFVSANAGDNNNAFPEPSEIPYRKLSKGEKTSVERTFQENNRFSFFSRTTKIESPEDVAYLFRQLESASVEHAFAFHETKDGKNYVQHLSTGTFNEATVDVRMIYLAAKAWGSSKVTLVHNHPSGEIDSSDADNNILRKTRLVFDNSDVEVGDGIILNLLDGKYGVFDIFGDVSRGNARGEDKVAVKTYSFDKLEFTKDVTIYDKQVTRPEHIAAFLSKSKFGIGSKYQVIILNHRGYVTARLQMTEPAYMDASNNFSKINPKFLDEVYYSVAKFGGAQVILVTNEKSLGNFKLVNDLKLKGRLLGFNLVDVVNVEPSDVAKNNYKELTSFVNSGFMEKASDKKNFGDLDIKLKNLEQRKSWLEKRIDELDTDPDKLFSPRNTPDPDPQNNKQMVDKYLKELYAVDGEIENTKNELENLKSYQPVKDDRQISAFNEKVGAYEKKEIIDDPKYKKLIENGYVTRNFDISSIAGKQVVIVHADNMAVGTLIRSDLKGKENLMKMDGGVHFPANTNHVWASTDTAMTKLQNAIATARKTDIDNGGDGTVYLAISKGTDSKALSNQQGATYAMTVLEDLVDLGLISPMDFHRSLKKIGRDFGATYTDSKSGKYDTEYIKKEVKKLFFDVPDATFEVRGTFIQGLVRDLGTRESPNNNIKGIRDALNSDSVGRKITFSMEGVTEAIGKLFGDKMTHSVPQVHTYAVIEINFPTRKVKSNHPSYPVGIAQFDPSGKMVKAKLHFLKYTANNNDLFNNYDGTEYSRRDNAALGNNQTGTKRAVVKPKNELPISGRDLVVTSEGWVYGFEKHGDIILKEDKGTPKTELQKVGHIFINWAGKMKPDLLKTGLGLVRGGEYVKSVKIDKFYIERAGMLPNDERSAYYLREALVNAIGTNGSKFESKAQREAFRQWTDSLWKAIAKGYGVKGISPERLSNMSIEDFTKKVKANIFRNDDSGYKESMKIISDMLMKGNGIQFGGLGKLGDILDPKVLRAVYNVGSYHIKNGSKTFFKWAKKMVKDVGDWIKRHLKDLWNELTKNRTGDENVVQQGLPVKAVVNEVKENLGVAVGKLRESVDAIKRVLSPAARSDESRMTAKVMTERFAKAERDKEVAAETFKEISKIFSKRSNAENLALIDAIETGKTLTDPNEKYFANMMRDMMDKEYKKVMDRKGTNSFIENYFPHIWERGSQDQAKFIFARRPLEGSKSFMKERKIPTTKEGIDLGLIPISYNPVDLTLLKLHEIRKYNTAREILDELKSIGMVKFIPVGYNSPAGWKKIEDKIGTVYGDPNTYAKEYVDKHLYDALEKLASDIGVRHQRKEKLKGKNLGISYGGRNLVQTKYATGEDTLAHEIGHQLDEKYNLWNVLTGNIFVQGKNKTETAKKTRQERVKIHNELRAIADLRMEGQADVTPDSHKKYLRQKEEKMAAVLQAYIHTPEKMRKVAPTIYENFEKFINSHDVLKQIKDIKPSLVHKEMDMKFEKKGILTIGHYYMPETAATVVNNHLSPGYRGKVFYDMFRQLGNTMNQVQLGMSLFHATFTSIDANVSKVALGLQKLTEGKVVSGVKDIVTSPLAFITNPIAGHELRKDYLSRNPLNPALVEAITRAGGRISMDSFYNNELWKTVKKNFKEQKYIAGSLKSPFALFEQLSRPVLEFLVPRQKLGVFSDMAKNILADEVKEIQKLGIDPDPVLLKGIKNKYTIKLQEAWRSVDNRLGQLVYDNLYWNRKVKDIAMVMVRSVGWNLGTFRELGGGVRDVTKILSERRLSPRTAYLLALPMVAGLIGVVYNYLNGNDISDDPETMMKDLYFPKTGTINKDGTEDRIALPTYLKDIYAYSRSPLTTLSHKVHPAVSTMLDLINNHDYYGTEISEETPFSPQWFADEGKYTIGQFKPFTVSNMVEMNKQGETLGKQMQSFFGFQLAPAYIRRSPIQNEIYDIYQKRFGGGIRSQLTAETQELKSELKDLYRRDPDEYEIKSQEAIDSGKITARMLDSIEDDTPSDIRLFKRFNAEDKTNLWRKMNDAEKERYLPGLSNDIRTALDLPLKPKLKKLKKQ